MGGLHKNITGSDLHIPGYVQSSDPGAVGAGMYWVDTSGGAGNWVAKIRNAANTDWEDVTGSGGGGGAADYDDLTSYKDLVTLQQSGAGLPSHAGKEAALHDGAGNQIISRTAVRHWLDPDPDAAVANSGSPFDETHEFSTLSSVHGWTALGSETVSVSNGVLNVAAVNSDGSYPGAVHTTSLAGDFDIVTTLWTPLVSDLGSYGYISWSIEDTVNSVSHTMYTVMGDTFRRVYVHDNGSPAALRVGGTLTQFNGAQSTRETLLRFARYSGTFYMAIGDYRWSFGVGVAAPVATDGWTIKSVASETRTFDRLRVGFAATSTDGTCLCPFIRRYL